MGSPVQFTTDYEGIRRVAADVDRCAQDMQAVRTTLAALGDPGPATFGEFGVAEAMGTLVAAWSDETAVIGESIAGFADAIRRAATITGRRISAAGRVDGMWGH